MLQDVSIICFGHAHAINFALTKWQKENEATIQPLKQVWMGEFP
jgi:hypothetical protein